MKERESMKDNKIINKEYIEFQINSIKKDIVRDEKYIIKLNGYFNHKLDELEFYLITYINEAQKEK